MPKIGLHFMNQAVTASEKLNLGNVSYKVSFDFLHLL